VSKARGFTLIELVIVVAIIAILAAIALPSYLAQVRKSRRSDVEQAIQQIALLQERFRADCTTYATGFGYACPTLSTTIFPSSPYTSSYYAIVVTTGTATGYKITATPAGTQAYDKAFGTACASLVYDFNITTSGAVTKTPAPCWSQ
jgi:type IV pilus assembly protein PilE